MAQTQMSNTYLAVPYSEKDSAKALGARWDGNSRRWFVPSGTEVEPFERWLPGHRQSDQQSDRGAVGADQTTDFATAHQGLPLSKVLQRVAGAVASLYPSGVWVVAEVLRVTSKNGHTFLELSERNGEGRVLAKASAIIWSNLADRILPEFELATGFSLRAGIKVLMRGRPVYKEQYGLSFYIDSIDSKFTLGDLEAKKRELRRRLKAEQLFDLNKGLPPPWDFFTALVVSPQGAAGLGDFSGEADRLAGLGVCEFTYVHSRFQGEGATGEMLETIAKGLRRFPDGAPPDVIVIIRGGGAEADLAWLNDYSLARYICECPIPVFTGIGHERDSCVLDEVAHTSFDTPSKVIAGIQQRIAHRTKSALTAFSAIFTQSLSCVDASKNSIERMERNLKAAATSTVSEARIQSSQILASIRVDSARAVQRLDGRVENSLGELRSFAATHIGSAKREVPASMNVVRTQALADLRTSKLQVAGAVSTVFNHAKTDIRQARGVVHADFNRAIDGSQQVVRTATIKAESLFREVAGQGPQKTLGRGFAMVQAADGTTVTSAQSASSAGAIKVTFKDGAVDAKVTGVTLGDIKEVAGGSIGRADK